MASEEYDFAAIEAKWQKRWAKEDTFVTKKNTKKEKHYVLEMYPYPSASFLHVGHVRNYAMGDVYARFQRMRGLNILYPMGYDSFGLPAEMAAKKQGIHPQEYTDEAIAKIMEYQKALGNSYDWSRVIASHDPNYYRWNQYFFLKLFEKGLAYRKKAPVNWCNHCQSVLANEEAEGGKCWRCGNDVVQKDLEQWFFKITAYADRLLADLEKIEWPEKIKIMQRNWIGRKEWIDIDYGIEGSSEVITVSTTRPDTNFGATFVVVAPEHAILSREKNLVPKEQRAAVDTYISSAGKKTDEERIAEGRKKTGVFTGLYCVNKLTGKKMPIWTTDFVLTSVGTGAVVGVPGHDVRDFEFAHEFHLPIVRVVVGKDGDRSEITRKEQVQEEEGTMINSGFLDGLDIHTATKTIMDHLEKKGWGRRIVRYKIRDWLISRQRYWGTPIPVVYCDNCGSSVQFDSYKSYLMGGTAITNDQLRKLKIQIIETKKDGDRLLLIQNSQIDSYLNLIEKKLDSGFWNEVVGNEIIFIFKSKDGKTKKFILNDKNSEEIAKLCAEFNGESYTKTSDLLNYLLDNPFYADYVEKIKDKGKPAVIPVPEKELPVKLPKEVDFGVTGNPLTTNTKFVKTHCPKCKKSARRETDTMGGFVDSSWYFLRFCDPHNTKKAFDPKEIKYWMPVDQYIGGAEHAVMHLMYARFFVKALHDLGFVDFDEPFMKLFNQGIVYKDGAKMSKSQGNVVSQTEISSKYGIDTLRLFLMFVSSPDKQLEWNDAGVEGSFRLLHRIIRLREKVTAKSNAKQDHFIHRTIEKVTSAIETFDYPKAIVAVIDLLDSVDDISKENYGILLQLISPFCPHLAEELWEGLGKKNFISISAWPEFNAKKINEQFDVAARLENQITSDVVNLLRLVKEKQNIDPAHVYLYVLPKETTLYDANLVSRRVGKPVTIFAVNDSKKYDPQGKSAKAKPGKAAIYLE